MGGRFIQKRITYFIVAALFIIAVIIVGTSISGMADTNAISFSDGHYKYYTSIKIQEGDSLWEIASEYMDLEYAVTEYNDIEEYVNDIRTLNRLNDDMIHAGEYLTIPYYSKEVL